MKTQTRALALPPTLGSTLDGVRRFVDARARQATLALLSRIQHGVVTVVDGDLRFTLGGGGTGRHATVLVHDPSTYRAILLGGSVGAAEAYIRGQWTCDDLAGLARILARNLDALDAMDTTIAGLSRRLGDVLRAARHRNTRAGSRRNIAQHYDLSNEFFRLFLDESMTYSSAIFERDDCSLEEAQRAKLDRICARLELRPDDHLLEIGTGWGALAVHAARRYGCRVTTTTISREQHRLATEKVAAAGLRDRVTVLLRDYRDLEGCYDKVVSVEMIEAVGHEYLSDYFRACSERLTSEGMLLLQAITIADQHHERHRTSVDFIKEHIFPGSCIPSITTLVKATTRATDLRLSHLDDLTPHYARTLRVWRQRFLEQSPRVRALGFDEPFIRMWDYYLAYCEGGFAERYLGCVHMLFTKPAARPSSLGAWTS
jgi:cyclopropane-fatty-acyl-phospholipid synthase